MNLKKHKMRLLGVAISLMAAVPTAQAALTTSLDGSGVLASINGFEFGGQTYNITFTEDVYGALSGVKFNDTDAENFASALATALNSNPVDAGFTVDTNASGFSWALVPKLETSEYYAAVQYYGSGYTDEAYGAGSWDWNVGLAERTGLNITAVPLPAAIYMFGAGLLGLFVAKRRKDGMGEASAA